MRIFRHLGTVPADAKGAVVAIGNFDGLHRGHQALIGRAKALAGERGVPLAVLAFEPTPQEYFRPDTPPFRITPFHAKARILAEMGVDVLIAQPFDAALAHQSAESFVADTLGRDMNVAAVAVGEAFRFGAKRGGDADLLRTLGAKIGFDTEIVAHVPAGADFGEQKVSSTLIRGLLGEGRVEDARALLGRPFAVEGTVRHGDKRGRTLGFPTANVAMDGYVRPRFGIYAVRATIWQEGGAATRHFGVANIGVRPMYPTKDPLLEAFLFDFSADIYGRHVVVELIGFLRAEAKFPSVEALVAQMHEDCRKAKLLLETTGTD